VVLEHDAVIARLQRHRAHDQVGAQDGLWPAIDGGMPAGVVLLDENR
jgi:hypothetical protein